MNASELAAFDAVAQGELVRRGEITPVELVEAAIERIETLNPTLNAVVTTAFDRAIDQARLRTPDANSAFPGVPTLLKDLITECAGMRLTEGSYFLRDLVSDHHQELVVRLERAGLVVLGKTNTPEFGMAPHCEPRRFGPTRNPWALDRSTAGSSGGSAAAVASGMVPVAHANDLGGSIRYPASCCGLFGLKPTRGRVPLGPEYADPLAAMATEHVLSRSVRDSAAVLDALSGSELGEPFPAPTFAGRFRDEVGRPPDRLRIAYSAVAADGYPTDPECVAALEDAVRLCDELGHDVEESWLPELTGPVGAAIGTFYGAATDWTVSYWIRRLGREPEPGELDPLTDAFWEHGRSIRAGEYLLAVEELRRYARQVAGFFTNFDLWLTPTLAQPPPHLGEMASSATDPFVGLRRSSQFVAFPGIIANITGSPAVSVPLYWSHEGLPIGVHFLGRYGEEATLIRLAGQLEQARPWNHRWPEVHA